MMAPWYPAGPESGSALASTSSGPDSARTAKCP